MNTNTECKAGNPVNKHIELNIAIEEIYRVRESADDLLSQIINRNEPCEGKIESTKAPQPSLEEILNESPDRIRKVCEEIHKIIEDIKIRLF